MAELEKSSNFETSEGSSVQIFDRPKGLKGLYLNPLTQVILLGFVCFMCPGGCYVFFFLLATLISCTGLFNALNGLGGGGQIDTAVSANANSALYATFAVAAFFAG